MEIEITEDLTTGISWIDDQHKSLFAKANNYISAVNQNRGHKEIETAIHLLEEYANTHFATEEKYMLQYGYHNHESHKNEHEKFRKIIKSLSLEYIIEDKSHELAKKIKSVLEGYIKIHVPSFDVPFAMFLRENKMN